MLLVASTNVMAQDSHVSSQEMLAVNTSFKYFSGEEYMTPPPPRHRSCSNGYTITANILGGVGGFLIGWPLGTLIAGGEPEWVLAGMGAGVLAVAIPLSIIGSRKCNGYGMIVPQKGSLYAKKKQPVALGIASNGNAVGLQVRF